MERPRITATPPWYIAAIELIGEIALAAERIGEARTMTGERVYPTDARSRFLRAIERSPYCLAIADAARTLGISRQAAHRIAYRAAAMGEVDLLTNRDDQRILQIRLTPTGRSKLHAGRAIESTWLATLPEWPRRSRYGDHHARRPRHPPAARARCARASGGQADSAKVLSNHQGDSP